MSVGPLNGMSLLRVSYKDAQPSLLFALSCLLTLKEASSCVVSHSWEKLAQQGTEGVLRPSLIGRNLPAAMWLSLKMDLPSAETSDETTAPDTWTEACFPLGFHWLSL